MSKIIPLITTANGNLTEEKTKILDAVKTAEKYTFPRLKIDWDIDLLVTNRIYEFIIPEDGVGGRTRTSDFIELSISDDGKATKEKMSEMLVHELCHAARWGKNDEYIKNLFDAIICEGIATFFEAEYAKSLKEKTVFISTIIERTDKENQKILKQLGGQLNSNQYDYDEIFYSGNDEIPCWAGYSAGYYLVKKYLQETSKTIGEAFADKYEEFRLHYYITKIDKEMADIEYGWLDKDGKRHESLDDFGEKYLLQLPEQLQDSKLGVCWDQVELERKLFKDVGIRIRTFFIVHYDDDKCPTHTFAIFEHNGKTYWYEHSWFPMRGLHGYADINEAMNDIRVRFIDGELKNEYNPDNLKIFEYNAPKKNLSCPEFYAHCEKGKIVKI